ncbi:MAG: hypothetical protein F2817_18555, partial [Actinobacteria bacterium]|nr:hypothetical protein [Actinomycetota bacterium]
MNFDETLADLLRVEGFTQYKAQARVAAVRVAAAELDRLLDGTAGTSSEGGIELAVQDWTAMLRDADISTKQAGLIPRDDWSPR